MLDEYVPGAPRGKRLAATREGYGCRSDGVEKGLERGGGDEVVGTVATRSVAAATAAAVSVAMSVLCVGAVGAGKGTGSAR